MFMLGMGVKVNKKSFQKAFTKTFMHEAKTQQSFSIKKKIDEKSLSLHNMRRHERKFIEIQIENLNEKIS